MNATNDLLSKHCVPCEGGTEPLTRAQAAEYLPAVPGWSLAEGKTLSITRELKLKDFGDVMAFANKMAAIAEDEGHHPDFCVTWNRIKIELVTHAIGGLSENDFIIAARINQLEREHAGA